MPRGIVYVLRLKELMIRHVAFCVGDEQPLTVEAGPLATVMPSAEGKPLDLPNRVRQVRHVIGRQQA